jgi:spermidine synthase
MASRQALRPVRALPAGLRYLDAETAAFALRFPPDMARRPTPVNRLDNQALVREFDAEWGRVE